MTGFSKHGRYSEWSRDKSLGHRTFGKTTVSCAFLSSKSYWGNLDENPHGLLRLSWDIHEPARYKLASAAINLDFLPMTPGPSPNVTEHVYPDIICGWPIDQHVTQSHSLQPELDIMGQSVGGIGMNRSADYSKTSRWHLHGSRLADERHDFTKASWIWQANKANEESEMIRAFQLAIILYHSEPSLKVVTTVEGRLRHGMRRFIFKSSKVPDVAIPIKLRQSNIDLDKIVETLAQEIVRLNLNPIPRQYTSFSFT